MHDLCLHEKRVHTLGGQAVEELQLVELELKRPAGKPLVAELESFAVLVHPLQGWREVMRQNLNPAHQCCHPSTAEQYQACAKWVQSYVCQTTYLSKTPYHAKEQCSNETCRISQT